MLSPPMFLFGRLPSIVSITNHGRRFLATQKKKFYKEVTLTQDNGSFEVCLDGRKLKTPAGSVVSVPSKPLALAIATEWRNQKDVIRLTDMHLTSLMYTAIDNPFKWTPEILSAAIINYLDTDTVCYRSQDPPSLMALEKDKWDPIIEWFMKEFNVTVGITDNIIDSPVTAETKKVIETNLTSYPLTPLLGVQFMTENLKSVILTHALMKTRLTVEEAVSLSRLEIEYQTSQWGNVEWAHDIDLAQMRARVSAGLLFFLLSQSSRSEVTRKAVGR